MVGGFQTGAALSRADSRRVAGCSHPRMPGALHHLHPTTFRHPGSAFPPSHSIESTFEVYIESERLYLFGLESPDSAREWLKSIAKVGCSGLGAAAGTRRSRVPRR